MELVKRLPTELQKIIKYYALESPFKKELEEYRRPTYEWTSRELLVWRDLKTNRYEHIVVNLYHFFSSYKQKIDYNFMTYFNKLYMSSFSRDDLYKRLKSLTNAKQREILVKSINGKRTFSRFRKEDLIQATLLHENWTD